MASGKENLEAMKKKKAGLEQELHTATGSKIGRLQKEIARLNKQINKTERAQTFQASEQSDRPKTLSERAWDDYQKREGTSEPYPGPGWADKFKPEDEYFDYGKDFRQKTSKGFTPFIEQGPNIAREPGALDLVPNEYRGEGYYADRAEEHYEETRPLTGAPGGADLGAPSLEELYGERGVDYPDVDLSQIAPSLGGLAGAGGAAALLMQLLKGGAQKGLQFAGAGVGPLATTMQYRKNYGSPSTDYKPPTGFASKMVRSGLPAPSAPTSQERRFSSSRPVKPAPKAKNITRKKWKSRYGGGRD